jgi:release factor glutamine methyltransferase
MKMQSRDSGFENREPFIGSLLPKLYSRIPNLDAQVLLAHILEKPRSWVLAHPEALVSIEACQRVEGLLARLDGGEPLPYVLGHWEFFGLDFIVTPDVLIPRPETELLVETAINWLRDSQTKIQNLQPKIVDVGTGSGCIAISLAVNLPHLFLLATDIFTTALQVAQANARKHGVADRIQFIQSDLLFSLTPTPLALGEEPEKKENLQLATFQPFDLLVANLPYIPTATLKTLAVYGKEPILALDGGPDGLVLIGRLLRDAPRYLTPGGLILLEIESSQGAAAHQLAHQVFPQAEIRILPDLSGKDRLLRIQTSIPHE